MAATAPTLTYQAIASGVRVQDPIITYSFPMTGNELAPSGYVQAFLRPSLQPLTTYQQEVFKQGFEQISAVARLAFVEVPVHGTIRIANSNLDPNVRGMAFSLHSGNDVAGDIFLDPGTWGSLYEPYTMLHETLHALGLNHPDDASLDSLMAPLHGYSQLRPIDIAALQALYGTWDPVNAREEALYRLYEGAWGSAPDAEGFLYWAGNDASLAEVSAALAQGHSSLSDAAFIRLVYENALGRSPEAAELNYYLGQDRGQVLLAISQSPENLAQPIVNVIGVQEAAQGL